MVASESHGKTTGINKLKWNITGCGKTDHTDTHNNNFYKTHKCTTRQHSVSDSSASFFRQETQTPTEEKQIVCPCYFSEVSKQSSGESCQTADYISRATVVSGEQSRPSIRGSAARSQLC